MDGSFKTESIASTTNVSKWRGFAKLISSVRSIAFDPNGEVFLAGNDGTIVSTTDRGESWHYESIKFHGDPSNHKLPAPWYWALAAVLMVVSSVVIAIPGEPPAAEVSVADWAVTDAPLKPGDVDSLNFTPMALGLSRFIRNPRRSRR